MKSLRRGMQTGVATATQGPATMFTTTDSVGSTAEAKLLSYLDASPSTSKVISRFRHFIGKIKIASTKFSAVSELCKEKDERA